MDSKLCRSDVFQIQLFIMTHIFPSSIVCVWIYQTHVNHNIQTNNSITGYYMNNKHALVDHVLQNKEDNSILNQLTL